MKGRELKARKRQLRRQLWQASGSADRAGILAAMGRVRRRRREAQV